MSTHHKPLDDPLESEAIACALHEQANAMRRRAIEIREIAVIMEKHTASLWSEENRKVAEECESAEEQATKTL